MSLKPLLTKVYVIKMEKLLPKSVLEFKILTPVKRYENLNQFSKLNLNYYANLR